MTALIVGAVVIVVTTGAAIALTGGRIRQNTLPNLPLGHTVAGEATLLPNGWQVTPAGQHIPLIGDLPLGMKVTPDGKYLLVSTSGYHNQSLNLISLETNKVVQSFDVAKTFYGLDVSRDGDVYLSGGNAPDKGMLNNANKSPDPKKQVDLVTNPVMHFTYVDGKLTQQLGIDAPALEKTSRYITGVAVGPDNSVYVANYSNDTIYKLDSVTKQVIASGVCGHHPYALAISPDGGTLAVSNWGDASVSLMDSGSLAQRSKISVANHPNSLAWSKDGRLFAANAGDNSVSVIKGDAVSETVKTSFTPQDPTGSTPDALAVSSDGKRLYVANADNNDVAVIDTSDAGESKVIGFIPTGWYPSSLALSPDGRKLYVGVGKGLQSNANATPDTKITHGFQRIEGYTYVGTGLSGAVSVVNIPSTRQLDAYTKQVAANMPKPELYASDANKADAEQAFSKIKHIVYIIRENRTYDEVFGDVKEGNGDSRLCLFGEKVTPNAHDLARRFVLLDNLYCNGEVSECGHQWCDSAYSTDYTERAWINSYSGRGEPDNDDMSDSPAGYLWDNCAKHGLTYKNYGEASSFHSDPNTPPVFTGPKALDGHASYAYSQIGWFSRPRDEGRSKIFIDDLHAGEASGNWPQLMVMSLPEDHTQGLQAGAYTPTANVGENDLALGKIVEAVSHSKFWKDTAIFVIEDDAQDGPDHVDARRTVGLIISPYIKKCVDNTMYSTVSFVRTMEMILHLPPMTQYDQDATPTYNSFTANADFTPFNLLSAGVDVEARNPRRGEGAVASGKLDLSAPDRADPDKLNAIIWHALRPGVPMPAPTRSAFIGGMRRNPS